MEPDFDDAAPTLDGVADLTDVEQDNAVEFVDRTWYRDVVKRGRWMDLIGDYAGTERFILDGEALLQEVLDDKLLAIGVEGEPSFQLAHALHSMERLLDSMLSRGAVFDIVFFAQTRHLTLQKGGSEFVHASRALARTLLFNHLAQHAGKIGLAVYTFPDLADPGWKEYRRRARPMFIMTNDGGEAKRKRDLTARDRCTLVQRMFIIHVLISEGIAVTLLRGAEFRDMKIFSFVFEQRYNPKARFPPGLLSAFQAALQSLEAADSSKGGAYALKIAQSERPRPLDDILVDLITRVNSSSKHERLHSHSLLWLFSLHCVLLPTLTLGQRARKLDPLHGDLSKELTSHFLPSLFRALSSTLLAHNDSIDVDGRLFVSLVTFTIAHSNSTLESLIGSDVYARGRSIWKTAGLGDPPPLVSFYSSYPQPSQAPVASSAMVPRLALMPFQNAVFDQELSSIQVSVDSAPIALEPLEFALGVAFEDDRHWHAHKRSILPKHLGGEAPQTTTEKQRRKVLKAEQRFMTSMQRLAATLTGASGGSLQQIVISPAGTRSRATQKQLPSSSAPKQQQKKGKAPVLSSADKIRVKKAEADMAKADAADGEWWAAQQTQLAALSSTPDKLEFLQRLSRNQRTQNRWLAVEIQMYRLDLEIAEWIADPDAENANVRDRHTVSLLRQVKDIYAITGAHPACVPILESILTSLGFSSLIPSLSTISVPPNARPLSFKFTKLLRSKSGKPAHKFMKITEHPVHWQLRLFGEYMDRSMDGQPDERVSFHPDAWQKRVLDCLDRKNCSLLVVAPTSAGKTFISFYAMEKLLKESDTDILVYVSPTKALVNQVAAEVYARFSKDLNGRSCWAVHTRDYRIHDPQKCQILVTVPEMLAIMLLSPPLANTWTPRIKRIILDEIHTIGQHEGGSVWEQILLLAPCPIIGLSATVGEPEAFNNWLASVQEAKGFEHEFILHPHRYSHLRKYAYFPQLLQGHKNEQMFSGLDSVKSTGIKRFIHPMTALSFNTTSLPSDLSLEASDVLTLYTAISALHPEALKADVSTLDPTVFFSETKLLTQKDILAYESALKQALEPLFSSSNSLDPDTALKTIVDSLMDSAIAKTDPSLLNAPPSKAAIRTKLLSLLTDLHAEGDLPALLFNFDRNDCEQMLTSVTDSLEKAEKLWRSSSPEWKRKIQAYERWKAGAKERQRRAEKLKSMKKSADDEPAPVEDQSWESSFDPDEPSPQFCFIGNTGFSRSDLEKEIDYLRWRGVPAWALNGLRRGIAVHHSGMNRAYRSLVERLFRLKFLQVVIATGTLALGINAPTKTSVFCGDSPFLTALMYRQCAGRAGRRGYDTLGKVVFYGIPLDRIYRLMLSKLPRLAGTFPLSSTLALRLFNLLHGSHYSTFAKDAIRSILKLPQISFGSSVGRDQLLHHLRFSIDYLRRAQLLDQEGQPINLFGMASHLYYTEPSNFALVALLQKGVIHDICERHNGIKAQHEIVLLMAHLFGRRYLPTVYTGRDALQEITRKYPSVVVLPPMRQEAAAVLSQHQERILQIFTTYAVTYCEQYRPELEADDVLPLSGIRYGTLVETSPFHDHLGSSAQDITARSVFVGNSGHADHFTSISELANTARRGLHLNEHAIPSFEQLLGARGKAHPLNAYLLDFYTHGQTVTLANANGIRPGEVWFVLQDFELTLKTVRGNLENLLLRSAVTAEAADDETTDVDSGYFTQDVTEIDAEDEAVEGKRVRPPGVSDRDWRVLEVFDEVVNVFSEKFRAMWA